MKYSVKMIVLDLDGTLLRTDQTISDHSKSVLRQCRERGIKVAYATGRGGSAERLATSALFDCRIVMNGAIASIDGRVVYNRLIPYAAARPLLIACDRYGLKTASEFAGMHYANFPVSDEWPSLTNYRIVDFSSHRMDAEKLYAVVRDSGDAAFIENHLPSELYLTVSKDNLAMIMHKEATKAKAIAEISRIFDITPPEIAAFGDDLNDIDMLSYAGIGVATENALDAVKAVSNFVCADNDADGPAAWIAENLL